MSCQTTVTSCYAPTEDDSTAIVTNECGTCGGSNTSWGIESLEATFEDIIDENKLPPFDVKISELPKYEKGLITIGDEQFEYSYSQGLVYQTVDGVKVPSFSKVPGTPGEITILKRGVNPYATNIVNDGQGSSSIVVDRNGIKVKIAPDYNNCSYMSKHIPGDVVQKGLTAVEVNFFNQFTCCRPATPDTLGISALMCPPVNPAYPEVVGSNCFVNKGIKGIPRSASKHMPVGDEEVVSWNDGSTNTRPGLQKVNNPDVKVDCNSNTFAKQASTGDITRDINGNPI